MAASANSPSEGLKTPLPLVSGTGLSTSSGKSRLSSPADRECTQRTFGAIAEFAAIDFQSKGWNGASLALGSFGTAYVVTRLLFGHWPDHFGGARVATWSLAIECSGQALLWLAPSPLVAIAGAALTGADFSLVFPSFGIQAVRQVPSASRGSALGAYVAFFDIGVGVSGPLTGWIAGTFGYSSVFVAGTLAAAAAICIAWRGGQGQPSGG